MRKVLNGKVWRKSDLYTTKMSPQGTEFWSHVVELTHVINNQVKFNDTVDIHLALEFTMAFVIFIWNILVI
jgi:hypothetical protein